MVPDEDEDIVRPQIQPAPSRKGPRADDIDDGEQRPRKPRREDYPEEEDEERVTARKSARKPRFAEEEDEELPARRPPARRRYADEEDEDDRPRRSRNRVDEEDEEDDRPRRRKGKTRKSGSKALVLILSIGGGVLLLGLFAVGAWVWPGFLRSGGSGGSTPGVAAGASFTDCKDALTYIPRDCTKVVGVDVAGLRKEAPVAASVKDLVTKFPHSYACLYGEILETVSKQTGKEFKDWCDYIVWGSRDAVKVAVLKTNVDINVEDIVRADRWASRKELQGKVYHNLSAGEFNRIYVPSPRVLVLAGPFVNDAQLLDIMTAAGAPAILMGDFQSAFSKAQKSHFWTISDQKWTLTTLENQLKHADNIPHLKKQKPAMEAFVQARPSLEVKCVAVGTTEVAYAEWHVCKDEASAQKVQSAAESLAKMQTDEEKRAALIGSIPRGPATRPDAVEAMLREAKTTLTYAVDRNLVARSYRVQRKNYDTTMNPR
jgi:hypothetical protein